MPISEAGKRKIREANRVALSLARSKRKKTAVKKKAKTKAKRKAPQRALRGRKSAIDRAIKRSGG